MPALIEYADFPRPLKLSFQEFVRDYKRSTKFNDNIAANIANGFLPTGPGVPCTGLPHYLLFEGLHDPFDLENHLALRKKHGLALLAMNGEMLIGMCTSEMSWVHPAYRGQRIGPEIQYERFLRLGPIAWRNPPSDLTPNGEKLMVRTYALLVARRIIQAPAATMVQLS